MMGDALAELELPWPDGVTAPPLVAAVPTTPGRVRARGYNQAELLARRMAARHGWRVVTALERRSALRSQTSLTPEARWQNVRGRFAPARTRGS